MSLSRHLLAMICISVALVGCDSGMQMGTADSGEMSAEAAAAVEHGPNGGRMLRDGDFAVELAVFETGVPPEFRAWVTEDGTPVDLGRVDLTVELERLDAMDEIRFRRRLS